MKMIVGLGNPGPKYQLNRHNIGFLLIDVLRNEWGASTAKHEFDAESYKVSFKGEQVLLLKPMTFMNLSGQAVQAAMSFYRIQPQDILVAHDEIDIDFARMRFQTQRSPGGHNGIKDIHNKIGDQYARLKLGVGRPPVGSPIDVATWVLQNFADDQRDQLEDFLVKAMQAVECFVEQGFQKAQNTFNS